MKCGLKITIKIAILTLFTTILLFLAWSIEKATIGKRMETATRNAAPFVGTPQPDYDCRQGLPHANNSGVNMLYAEEELLNVLKYTLERIDKNNLLGQLSLQIKS